MGIGRPRRQQSLSRLAKKAKFGFRGYPLGTVALYGPDDTVATKLVVAILADEGAEPEPLEKWFVRDGDIRDDEETEEQALAFLRRHQALTVVLSPGIIGCPHEEVIDYPEGESCPRCPFWRGRDRWAGGREE